MKISKKKRRGRKANPVPHKPHRNHRAIRDPLTKAEKRTRLMRQREDDERVEQAAW